MSKLRTLGFEVSVLIVGRLAQGSSDWTTAFRIRQYYDNSSQNWIAKNDQSFNGKERKEKFEKFLCDNDINVVLAINPLICAELITGCELPYGILFSGSELVEGVKDLANFQTMTDIVTKASVIVATTEQQFSRAVKIWPEIFRSGRLKLLQRGVITRPSAHPSITNSWMKKYRLNAESLMFTMVAKVHPSKDLFHIIPAFTHWHQLHVSHPYLIIVGPKVETESNYFKEFMEIVDGTPGVFYVGCRNLRDAHRLIADSFALINSASTATSVAIPILEAMDLGVPVVARNIAVHSSIIEDKGNGLLYTCHEDFIEKVEMLLNDGELRHKIVENAKTYVSQRHCCVKEKNDYSELVLKLKEIGVMEKMKNQEKDAEEKEDEKDEGEDSTPAAETNDVSRTDVGSEKKVRFQKLETDKQENTELGSLTSRSETGTEKLSKCVEKSAANWLMRSHKQKSSERVRVKSARPNSSRDASAGMRSVIQDRTEKSNCVRCPMPNGAEKVRDTRKVKK